ncbi:hypothetical protein [Paraburkholderia caribensis]|uniref:hypothetical protein n=2 Tax=Burkholderiaceae TaxID=119060 RepID=UPI00158FF300|nr:hypothetical protein [Paraburkholderia caribensis]
MAYNLFLDFCRPVSVDEVTAYFESRRWYRTLCDVVEYWNPNTGVDFSFNVVHDSHRSIDGAFGVNFQMHSLRPHVFCLEAEHEIRACANRFSATVFDPVSGSMMSDEEISTEALLRGWKNSGEIECRERLQGTGATYPVYAMPARQIGRSWHWNYQFEASERRFRWRVTVPHARLFAVNGVLYTGIVWYDSIPDLIPDVDVVIVVRHAMSLNEWHAFHEYCLLRQSDLDAVLAPLTDYGLPMLARRPLFHITPAQVRGFVSSLVPSTDHIAAVPLGRVLDQELFIQHLDL